MNVRFTRYSECRYCGPVTQGYSGSIGCVCSRREAEFYTMPPTSKWFNCQKARPNATYRLICFPWCGGGSQFYARWGTEFPTSVEVIGVRLPTRETRRDDRHPESLQALIKLVSDEIKRVYSSKPVVLFGHSMGVILAFETARYLQDQLQIQVAHVFFSSCFPPQSDLRQKDIEDDNGVPLHRLPDKKLMQRIASHGGTPKTMLENKDLMKNFIIPPYKADLTLIYDYKYELIPGKKPLSCPLIMFDGKDDKEHYLNEYRELTSGPFRIITFPGKHFWLLQPENSTALRKRICEALALL